MIEKNPLPHSKITDAAAREQAATIYTLIRNSCFKMSPADQGAFLAEVVMMASAGIMTMSDARTASDLLDQTAITLIGLERKRETQR